MDEISKKFQNKLEIVFFSAVKIAKLPLNYIADQREGLYSYKNKVDLNSTYLWRK